MSLRPLRRTMRVSSANLEVALTLQDQHGNILKNEAFETQYVPAE